MRDLAAAAVSKELKSGVRGGRRVVVPEAEGAHQVQLGGDVVGPVHVNRDRGRPALHAERARFRFFPGRPSEERSKVLLRVPPVVRLWRASGG